MVNFVGVSSESKDIKLKNLLIVGGLVGFITILFHFTVVYFFGLILKSVFLVGLFLAISNVISLIFDIPIGVLQKYIKPKTFIVLSGVMIGLATLVFFKFVYIDGISGTEMTGNDGKKLDLYGIFSSLINFLLLVLAASLYGLQSETFGVTSYSYILNNTSPTEYAKYLSRYNIASGAGSMLGLIFSGILLGFNIQVALIIFLILTVFFIIFVGKYFDNGIDTINLSDIKKFKIDSFKFDLGKSGTKISQIITKENLVEITKETKVLFLKPLEMKNSINFKEIYDFTVLNFKIFIKIIFKAPINIMMFWIFFILMQFSFWDTFVSTFMIEFLEEVMSSPDNPLSSFKFITGYVLLGIIAIPGFVLQDPFINLSKKVGEFKILMFGTFLSGLSLFLFGFFQSNVIAILILGIINSVGYAAVIGIGQGLFSEKYNILYAVRNNLKQIDSTVSAAPLKIVLNLANVVGLLFGSLIVQFIGFAGFFFVFGGLLISLFIYSVINYKKINEAGKEGEGMFGGDSKKSGEELEVFDGEVFKG